MQRQRKSQVRSALRLPGLNRPHLGTDKYNMIPLQRGERIDTVSNNNGYEGRTFGDFIGLGNSCGTMIILLLLAAILILGTPVALMEGLQLDRLSDQLDNGQREHVYAYPTPTPHNTLNQMSPGDKLREEARQFREQQRQNRQPSGQSSSFPFPFSGK